MFELLAGVTPWRSRSSDARASRTPRKTGGRHELKRGGEDSQTQHGDSRGEIGKGGHGKARRGKAEGPGLGMPRGGGFALLRRVDHGVAPILYGSPPPASIHSDSPNTAPRFRLQDKALAHIRRLLHRIRRHGQKPPRIIGSPGISPLGWPPFDQKLSPPAHETQA